VPHDTLENLSTKVAS